LFVIPNVPAPVNWYVYGKMESIAALGATSPVTCATRSEQQEVNVGDIQIQPGHHVHGKVTLSDGAAIAGGMRITVDATKGFDSQTVIIGQDGSFDFAGLPAGDYEIFASIRGYRLSEGRRTISKTVNADIDDVAIVLDPAPRR
jgi:hypothetical protein